MSGETKAELIADIRKRLRFVRIGHPGLADEIGAAMEAVEDADRRDAERPLAIGKLGSEFWRLADPTETTIRVGTIVRGFESGRSWLGLVVQVGDEDEHPGGVLVHMADGPGYPCWWAEWVVIPVAQLAWPR